MDHICIPLMHCVSLNNVHSNVLFDFSLFYLLK